jgi:hypothetical protein
MRQESERTLVRLRDNARHAGFSAKTWNGNSTLSFISDCGMLGFRVEVCLGRFASSILPIM